MLVFWPALVDDEHPVGGDGVGLVLDPLHVGDDGQGLVCLELGHPEHPGHHVDDGGPPAPLQPGHVLPDLLALEPPPPGHLFLRTLRI